MKKNKKNLTRADYNFMITQRGLFLFDLVIAFAIIFVLAKIALLFTDNIVISGMIPIIAGYCYIAYAFPRRHRKVRNYWDNH